MPVVKDFGEENVAEINIKLLRRLVVMVQTTGARVSCDGTLFWYAEFMDRILTLTNTLENYVLKTDDWKVSFVLRYMKGFSLKSDIFPIAITGLNNFTRDLTLSMLIDDLQPWIDHD